MTARAGFSPYEYAVMLRHTGRDGDHRYSARVRELDMTLFAAHPGTAYLSAVYAIAGAYEAAREQGKDFPEPIKD
jgi:hypothetical protein